MKRIDSATDRTEALVRRRRFLSALCAAVPLWRIRSVLGAQRSPGPWPAADEVLSRIAFGSCHKLDRPFGVWDAMLGHKPDLFIFLGDTVYKDTVDMEEKRAEYAKLAAVPNFAAFRKEVPILATWDDHDYGANDGGADYPKRDDAKKIFLDFFDEPHDSPRWNHGGVYGAWVFGPAGKRTQVILLDTRYFRSKLRHDDFGGYLPLDDPHATFLGDEQWRWLGEQLKVPAELRLLVSSIQVEAEDQPNEKWSNLPRERERLFKLIADSKAQGVVLISGDRHHGEISSMDVGCGYRVYEVTSSGLNCPYDPYDEPNRHREGQILWSDNFGMVRVDWSAADPSVDLEVHTGKGFVGLKKELRLSDLRAAK
ncbi:MAG TPA: alkaline phosphatase D family protein [Tepidisphaeraceae bacterium]|jgi:alkaline phosphatase D